MGANSQVEKGIDRQNSYLVRPLPISRHRQKIMDFSFIPTDDYLFHERKEKGFVWGKSFSSKRVL
jgi:hypothetical protein